MKRLEEQRDPLGVRSRPVRDRTPLDPAIRDAMANTIFLALRGLAPPG